jgi:hypothetical protein
MGYNEQNVLMNYTPTEDIIISNDTEKTSISDTYEKLKEITITSGIAASSKFRFKFEGKEQSGSHPGYARIYRNGVAIGTEADLTINYVVYTEDINASNWVVGDKIQLWAHGEGGWAAYVKNFRLHGKGSEFTNTLE